MGSRVKAAITWTLVLAGVLTVAASQVSQGFENRAQSRTLANGLTLVTVERPGKATFGGMLACMAGYADDPSGGAGTAHLVEHLLAPPIIGSIGPSRELYTELSREYEKAGGADSPRTKALEAEVSRMKGRGQWNIGTTADFVYYGVMDYPAEWLERFLRAEAQTLKAIPDGDLRAAKETLIGEIRGTVGRDARGQIASVNLAVAFPDHPYGAAVGGRLSDIPAMTLESLRAFKAAHYSPDRCVVVLVGDIRPATFFPMAEKWLGDVPKSASPSGAAPRPRARQERRSAIESAAGPRVIVSYVKPPIPSRDNAVAEVVASVLGAGNDSRRQRQGIRLFGRAACPNVARQGTVGLQGNRAAGRYGSRHPLQPAGRVDRPGGRVVRDGKERSTSGRRDRAAPAFATQLTWR